MNTRDMSDFPEQKDCIIGNGVWIGNNVTVMQGVKIGNGSVLGSGTIVTHDVEPYSVVVGVPGRAIKKLFSEDDIEFLENVNWFDWSYDDIAEATRCGAMNSVSALKKFVKAKKESVLSIDG